MFTYRKFSLLASAAFLCLGCLENTDDAGPPDTRRIHPGAPIDSILGARTAVAVGKTLYVANRDTAAMGIVAVDIATDKVTAFWPQKLPPNDLALAGDSLLVIVESDFATGAISRLNLKTGKLEEDYREIDPDNALSSDGGDVYLVEKTLGVVTGFRRGRLETANVFLNVQTGAGSNPYRAAVSGGKAYITRYNSASLLMVDATLADGGQRDSIDLSAFAANELAGDPMAKPDMDGVVAYGGRLFITVQRLTGYQAKDTAKVVIVDIATRKVTGAIDLNFRNPIAAVMDGKFLYVSGIDGYLSFTGGVERIDLNKGENLGKVVDEAELAADNYNFVPAGTKKGYVFHAKDFKVTRIKAITLP